VVLGRGGGLRLRTFTIALCVSMLASVASALSKSGSDCPYSDEAGTPACTNNPNPDPIPQNLGGTSIGAGRCVSTLVEALASMDSYNESSCHRVGEVIVQHLVFISDATDYLPVGEQKIALNYDFHAGIYCYQSSNVLIVAYRGSVEPTQFNHNAIEDWIDTNVGHHLGTTPNQYLLARDAADLIKRRWSEGGFDNFCAEGRPQLVLTGHSKGGGQAQYAGLPFMLDAIVFNSDPADPLTFADWALMPEAPIILQWLKSAGRTIQSLINCVRPSPLDPALENYYASGKVIDIRMVNDTIAKYVLSYCSLPQAPFEWLSDTSTCSVNHGHDIDTVISELKVCAPDTRP
jgi:hypothetical protein